MYVDNHGPVTLREIYLQVASCQRTVNFAQERSRISEQFLPLETYSSINIAGFGLHHFAMRASPAWSRSPQDSPRHPRAQCC